MSKTITVKGWGNLRVKPDYVVISLSLEAMHVVYDEAVRNVSDSLTKLQAEIKTAGFKEDELKTTNYNVRTHYENERMENGEYQRVFKGYVCTHSVKLTFDYAMERLNQAIHAVSLSASPDLSIQFTLKDATQVENELLEKAICNATQKAEILCKSAHVKLGELKKIDYDLQNPSMQSNTRFNIEPSCLKSVGATRSMADFAIEPDWIEVKDCVSIEWEIEEA